MRRVLVSLRTYRAADVPITQGWENTVEGVEGVEGRQSGSIGHLKGLDPHPRGSRKPVESHELGITW